MNAETATCSKGEAMRVEEKELTLSPEYCYTPYGHCPFHRIEPEPPQHVCTLFNIATGQSIIPDRCTECRRTLQRLLLIIEINE
jgi:hypothetical protein